MKCHQCSGALAGAMTFCPYCACPSCESTLSVIEFDTSPPLHVERCFTCHGMFFNPGEIQALLDQKTNSLVWLDTVQINQIATDYGYNHEVVYRKCPMCAERMSHLNFGGRSGVILDRCGTHGLWVDGGELRQLTEWWRAGGKLIFQQNEADKTKKLFAERHVERPRPPQSIESSDKPQDWSWTRQDTSVIPGWLDVLVDIASVIID
jgi:Zn-finger nucleic acid-binding protein